MKPRSLRDLTTQQIEMLSSSESQILAMIPIVIRIPVSPALRKLLRERTRQAQLHINRLNLVLRKLHAKSSRPGAKAMTAILREGKVNIQKVADPKLRESEVIALARQCEHYAISAYGTARTYLEALGEGKLAEVLQASLDEAIRMDEKLNTLAEKFVNREADIRL